MQFVRPFSEKLEELLAVRYRDHWHPCNPGKGSAYRCIRINGKIDPLILEAGKATGLSNFEHYLPKEFTMWIDPEEVSYRFGEDGSISQCPLSGEEDSRSCSPPSQWDSPSRSSSNGSTYMDFFTNSPAPSLSLAYKAPISVHV